jgi:hypothetical protein
MALTMRHLAAIAPSFDLDFAVLSGVTVHGPDREYVWPGEAAVVAGGRRQALVLD